MIIMPEWKQLTKIPKPLSTVLLKNQHWVILNSNKLCKVITQATKHHLKNNGCKMSPLCSLAIQNRILFLQFLEFLMRKQRYSLQIFILCNQWVSRLNQNTDEEFNTKITTGLLSQSTSGHHTDHAAISNPEKVKIKWYSWMKIFRLYPFKKKLQDFGQLFRQKTLSTLKTANQTLRILKTKSQTWKLIN